MDYKNLKLFIKNVTELLNNYSVRYFYDATDPNDYSIYFQNNTECNERGPYIYICFRKKYVNFSGFQLSKAEKAYKICYNRFNSAEEFVEYLVVLLRKYFKSFELVRNSSFLSK